MRTCYYQLRQLRLVCRALPIEVEGSLIQSLICTRVDYCNSSLFGASAINIQRLQSVLNSAARFICRLGLSWCHSWCHSWWTSLASDTIAYWVKCLSSNLQMPSHRSSLISDKMLSTYLNRRWSLSPAISCRWPDHSIYQVHIRY